MEVEMKIRGLMVDPVTNMPIVVLKDVNGMAILPIWVGLYEAQAIALEIEKQVTPMTGVMNISSAGFIEMKLIDVIVCGTEAAMVLEIHATIGGSETIMDCVETLEVNDDAKICSSGACFAKRNPTLVRSFISCPCAV